VTSYNLICYNKTRLKRNSEETEQLSVTKNFVLITDLQEEQGYLSRYSDRLLAGQPKFCFRQGQQIVLLSTASRPALRPIQPPIHWVPGLCPLG
jgi:hypothetical protein